MSRVEVKRIHSSFYEVAIGGGVFLKGILYGSQIVPRLNTKLVCRNYMPLILKSDLEHAFFFFAVYTVDKIFLTMVMKICNSVLSNDNAETQWF